LDRGSLHSKIRCVLHLFVNMRGLKELLRRNAAAQSARAAEPLVFLDNRDLQTQLSGANCRDIAARTAANHRYIELFVSQFWKIPLSG